MFSVNNQAFNNQEMVKKEIEIMGKSNTDMKKFLNLPNKIIQAGILDTNSIEPEVLLVTDGNTKYIVKYLITNENMFENITHEAFVGLMGLNKLHLPNFVKVIGFDTNYPCFKNKRCAYVVYEYVEGITLLDYFSSASVENLKSIYRQIIMALYLAYKAVDFTHYDLHYRNIIIRDGIPVIIDYGNAHIKYGNKDWGVSNMEGLTFSQQSMWFHDIFKLLFGTYYLLSPERILKSNKQNVLALEEKINLESRKLFPDKKKLQELNMKLLDSKTLIAKYEQKEYVFPGTEFLEYLGKLLSFFFPKNTIVDSKFVIEYHQDYPYFSPPYYMKNYPHDFDKFLAFALDILK